MCKHKNILVQSFVQRHMLFQLSHICLNISAKVEGNIQLVRKPGIDATCNNLLSPLNNILNKHVPHLFIVISLQILPFP